MGGDQQNVASGKLVDPVGDGQDGSKADPFCETFVTTLHQWCDHPNAKQKPPRRRPSFNNMYFNNLPEGIRNDMLRECPVIFANGKGKIWRASAVLGTAGVLASLGAALLGAYDPSNGPNWKEARDTMREAFLKKKTELGDVADGYHSCFPDGLSKDGKTWLEIKRPLDEVSPYQRAQHKAFEEKTGNPVTVAGCDCPGAECKDGNDCPEGYPPADPI